MNIAAVLIYSVVWLTITYLIYRYARYSPWWTNLGGKSVMIVKSALWMLVTYALATSLGLDGVWQDVFRWTMVGGIEIALLHQVWTIIRLQGGWRRRNPVLPEYPHRRATDLPLHQ